MNATVGTASGVGSASGEGAIIAATVGTAAGVGDAKAAATAVFSGVGTAAGTGAASGVGSDVRDTVGTAAGVGSALALSFYFATTASFLVPDADISDGGWLNELGSATDIYHSIDEASPNASDYAISSTSTGDIYRFRLSDPSGAIQEPFIFLAEFRKEGTATANLKIRLFQGATQIREWTYTDISSDLVRVREELSSLEFAAITDPTDLFVELENAA
jgi:hypothetical protein